MIIQEDLKDEKFTKAYDMVMNRKDLSFGEKVMLCRALAWPDGWYESVDTISKWAGCSRRTVQRIIKQLVKKGELAPLYDKHRTLYPTILGLPLFEYAKSVSKKLSVKSGE